MADDYLGRKMEEYMSRPASSRPRPAATLHKLLVRNRSHRSYDAGFTVREDQLRRIIAVNPLIPSALNRQALRFRPVLADEASKVTPLVKLGGALPELHLPQEGCEPNAYIVICAATEEDRYLDIDLGISAQSMLLQAAEIGLNGICIASFDKAAVMEALNLEPEPLLILAIGRGTDNIELVDIGADGDRRYYRRDGKHFVPKVVADELIVQKKR